MMWDSYHVCAGSLLMISLIYVLGAGGLPGYPDDLPGGNHYQM